MFSNKKQLTQEKMENHNLQKERNIISQGTKIVGTIISDGDFRIDGRLEGDLNIKGKLVIGKSGSLEGTMSASNSDIEGNVKGKITISELLSIKSSGIIEGDVKTNKIAIESGAIFNVKCSMINSHSNNHHTETKEFKENKEIKK